jgi:hypothetical protein
MIDLTEDLSAVDTVLLRAEEKRVQFCAILKDLGLKTDRIASGSVHHKGHWDWHFILSGDSQEVDTSIVLDLDEESRCSYEVEVIIDRVRAYSAAGISSRMEDAPDLAFKALVKLLSTAIDDEEI